MSNETYTTPEGFELHRPLLLPDARTFGDVLTYVREWDFATTNHRNGVVPRPDLVPEPRYLHDDQVGGVEIGPFCSVELRTPDGDRRRSQHLAVRATDAVVEVLRDAMMFSDRVSFRVIEHHQNRRALVIAEGNIGSRWLAYTDPASIPTADDRCGPCDAHQAEPHAPGCPSDPDPVAAV